MTSGALDLEERLVAVENSIYLTVIVQDDFLKHVNQPFCERLGYGLRGSHFPGSPLRRNGCKRDMV